MKTLFPSDFAQALVAVALAEVGIREVGNNGGADVAKFMAATWDQTPRDSWCAGFVCWCMQQAITKYPVDRQRLLAIRPTTPRAFELEDWGRSHARMVGGGEQINAGDIIVFTFSHCGIAVVDQASEDGVIDTVEGNTNGSGGREGDGVYRRERATSAVKCAIRLVG
jgi:hypothetical protein